MVDSIFEKMTEEDVISRRAYIERYRKWAYAELGVKVNNETLAIRVAMSLPPVTPQSKTGHWLLKYSEDGLGERYSYWECSECGRVVGSTLSNIEEVLSDYPYCHCGAKMQEVEE